MDITVSFSGKRMQVRGLPDDPNIMAEALRVGGRFRHRTGMWSFSARSYNPVMEFLRRHYKYDEIAVFTKRLTAEPSASVM